MLTEPIDNFRFTFICRGLVNASATNNDQILINITERLSLRRCVVLDLKFVAQLFLVSCAEQRSIIREV